MNALADGDAPACLSRVGGRGGVPGTAIGLVLGSDQPLVCSVASDPGRGPLEIRAAGYSASLAFRVDDSSFVDGRLATPKPEEVVRTRTRRHHRAAAPPGAWIRFMHPVWPEVEVRRPLVDLALEGVGFLTEAIRDAIGRVCPSRAWR